MRIEEKNILDIKGVSEYTTLSKSTIYKKMSENKIPHHKINGRTLFMRDEIDDWIRNDGVMTDQIPEIKLFNIKDHGNLQGRTG
jgi:excisionase family DNA binding protein